MKHDDTNVFHATDKSDPHGSDIILIVDDDDGVRETMLDILSEMNFVVFTASNGFEAIDQLKKFAFPVVIMDIKMPGMNGIETFDKIHAMRPSTRVIFTSAYIGNHVIPRAWTDRVDGVFNKPINLNNFIGTLRRSILIQFAGDDPPQEESR